MPYVIRLNSPEPRVSWDGGERGRKDRFGLKEASSITDLMLTRKMRNNGVGRQLMSRLAATGACATYFRDQSGQTYGFAWARSRTDPSAYELRLVGDYPHPLLRGLNRALAESYALAAHRQRKELQRAARRAVSHLRHRGGQRSIIGDNGGLHLHFKNTPLTWAGALRIISRAARMRICELEARLLASMIERGVAALRLKTTFVIRVNLGQAFAGDVPAAHPVTLWSTKDNRHPVYRRLRKAFRQIRTGTSASVSHQAIERRSRRRMRFLVSQAA